MNKYGLMAFAALCFYANAAYAADEIKVTTADRTSLSVAIYNSDLAVVKDTRNIDLKKGVNDVAFLDVSAGIQPETALLQGKSIAVLEQNYNYDMLSPSSILDKYVGKRIQVISTNEATGAETTEDAIVLSNNGGVVLKIGNRIETGYKGRYVFPDIPANLRDRPTLTLKVNSADEGVRPVSLSYLTGALSWKADYVAELGADETSFALDSWVTLNNNSGVSYENATLQLIAGDVNRVARPRVYKARALDSAVQFAAVNAVEGGMAEEEFMDYHLYTLGRPTSIMSNQSKQVSLLASPKVDAHKVYRFDNLFNVRSSMYSNVKSVSSDPVNPAVILEFKNDEKSGLGIPLPGGTFRVYKQDSKGNLLFVGEDSIRHTAKDNDVKIKLGKAFDINAVTKVVSFKKLSSKTYEGELEITFKNSKNEDVKVDFYQSLPDGYKILSESVVSEKQNANQVLWVVPVPANSETIFRAHILVSE